MSDENLTNLEDDTPDADAGGAPAPNGADPTGAVAAQPPAPAAVSEDDKPAEVEAVEVGGQKYVPVGAIKAEREKRQTAEREVQRLAALEAQLNELRPYAEFVKNNPQLLQPRQPEQPPQRTEPEADQSLVALATALDLYTTDAKPDLKRAQTIKGLIDATAQQHAAAAVQPIRNYTAEQQSAINFQRALQVQDADGHKPTEASLRAVWGSMPAADTADPRVAGILAMTALGMDRLTRKSPPQAPPLPPVITEASGGHPQARPLLSDLEAKAAKERGLTQKAWAERTANYQRGVSNTLED